MSSFFCNFSFNIYFFIWFLCFNFSFIFWYTKEIGIYFSKNLSKKLFKKGQKSLLLFFKLFEYPLNKFNNFKPSFSKFFYSGVFCFYLFLLAHYLFWKYFSLSSIWKFKFIYVYIYIYVWKVLSLIPWENLTVVSRLLFSAVLDCRDGRINTSLVPLEGKLEITYPDYDSF